MKWIVQWNMWTNFDQSKEKELSLIFNQHNSEAVFVDWNHNELDLPYKGFLEPVILYGSQGFLRKFSKDYLPGCFVNYDNLSVHVYSQHLPVGKYLNENYIMLSLGEVIKRKESLLSCYNGKFFMRPNSGTKTFTGLTISSEEFDHEINSLLQITSATKDTIVCISEYKEIDSESRFLICDRKVITGSGYTWGEETSIGHGYYKSSYDLAEEVANLTWQPDVAYVCDICETDGESKILELNGFSCAGMYRSDWNKIVPAINKASVDYFNDLMGIVPDKVK